MPRYVPDDYNYPYNNYYDNRVNRYWRHNDELLRHNRPFWQRDRPSVE